MEGEKKQFRKSRMTRKKIINQAYEFFLSVGFAETTVAMISKAVGVSYGTVYTYFNSKSDIFIEIIEDTVQELYSMARTPFFPKTAKEAYFIICEQAFSHQSFAIKNKRILEIIEEAMHLSPEVRLKWQHIQDYFLGTIAQDIRYSQNAGLLREGVVPEITARKWYATNEWFLWEIAKNPERYDIAELSRIISREYVVGIYNVKDYDELIS